MVVVRMVTVFSPKDLLDQFESMSKENSVRQVFIPGKGKFTIRFENEDQNSIASDVQANPNLERMMHEGLEAYKSGKSYTTDELLKSLSIKDFS
jgi:hypothetical protein